VASKNILKYNTMALNTIGLINSMAVVFNTCQIIVAFETDVPKYSRMALISP